MALQADRARRGRQTGPGWFSWWTAGGFTILWRLPLLLVLGVLLGWYVFRGLVRMSFIFTTYEVASFLLAPILLPLAALPAYFVWLLLRHLPRVWRDVTVPLSRKAINTVALIPAAVLIAAVIDRLETFGILAIGIQLPRFLVTTY